MKSSVLILSWVIFISGLYSCNQSQNNATGLIYEIHEDKSGKTIQEGDYVALSSIEKTEEGQVVFNSYENERPVLLLREKALFKDDFNTALGLLSEGDSATFKIKVDSITKTDRSKIINTKNDYLIYTVKVNKVIPRGELNDDKFNRQIELFHKTEIEKAEKSEAAKINKYILSQKLKPAITKSGLNYIIVKKGTGAKPLINDTVLINYTARLFSGKVFGTTDSVLAKKHHIYDHSPSYGPMKLTVINAPVSGFQEALALFSPGTKAELIIPSKLAYGNQGNSSVQPYTPVLCEIEIVGIIPQKKKSF